MLNRFRRNFMSGRIQLTRIHEMQPHGAIASDPSSSQIELPEPFLAHSPRERVHPRRRCRVLISSVITAAFLGYALPAFATPTLMTADLITAEANAATQRTTAKKTTKKAAKPPLCRARVLLPIGQYVLRAEQRCAKNVKKAKAAGFSLLTDGSKAAKKRRKTRTRSTSCPFVEVPTGQLYLDERDTTCFANSARAERKGYTHFSPAVAASTPVTPPPIVNTPVVPTAVPTTIPGTTATPIDVPTAVPPTATPDSSETATPSATPTRPAAGDPITWNFILVPTEPESGAEGSCSATINGARTSLTYGCTHNVTTASEVHLHPIPSNGKFCALPLPGLSFTHQCELTSEEAGSILAGNTIVSIHVAPGGPNQALVNYIPGVNGR